MILITKSPKKVIGLEGYDIKITKQCSKFNSKIKYN